MSELVCCANVGCGRPIRLVDDGRGSKIWSHDDTARGADCGLRATPPPPPGIGDDHDEGDDDDESPD